jgi:hypothetical protein
MKVLVAGESWTTFSTHVKGADSFTTSRYATGIEPLRTTLRGFGHEVVHLPAEHVPDSFPATGRELGRYDVVILSDIGSNSFYLSTETFEHSVSRPDRLEVLRQWASDGGGLVMIGGYLSFSGIDARARFGRGATRVPGLARLRHLVEQHRHLDRGPPRRAGRHRDRMRRSAAPVRRTGPATGGHRGTCPPSGRPPGRAAC